MLITFFIKNLSEVQPRAFLNSLHQLNSFDNKFTAKFMNFYINQKEMNKEMIFKKINEVNKYCGFQLKKKRIHDPFILNSSYKSNFRIN